MALWIATLTGHVRLDPDYGVLAWHAHEFLFGYVGAVIVGFLLTAGPNWTGCRPLSGAPLFALFVLWIAGRVSLFYYSHLGLIALIIDSALLIVTALWFAYEIISARNWLNLRIVMLISALAAANVLFHWEIVHHAAPDVSIRITLALIIALIMVIGGRITPMFTRNWLIARKRPPYPPLFNYIDAIAIATGVIGLLSWATLPTHPVSGYLLLAGGAAQLARVAHWRGIAVYTEPLILVLHLGYVLLLLGFIAVGLSVLRPDLVPTTGALHVWMAGAIGLTTLGVMTRVSLSDTGRPPRITERTMTIYAIVILAVVLRFLSAVSAHMLLLLKAAAVAWIIAFTLFVIVYGPLLVRPGNDD